jgi:outer membrane biosynthesis protein TonB
MQKKYVYSSIIFHIAIVLLCVIDISFLSNKREFDEQPPIIVDLNDVKISDMTNIPELAVKGEERKVATRKDEPNKEVSSAVSTPQQQKNNDIKEPEPEKVEEVEIKSPSLIETPAEEPKKESKEPIKEKKKPAPIPQRKPQVKPNKKPEQKKKPEPKKTPPQNERPDCVASDILRSRMQVASLTISPNKASGIVPYNSPAPDKSLPVFPVRLQFRRHRRLPVPYR